MDIWRHKFSQESRIDLLEFLSLAIEMKTDNANCDLKEYERLKNLFTLDCDTKSHLKSYVHNNKTCIDICLSDEDGYNNVTETHSKTSNSQVANTIEEVLLSQPNVSTEDVVYAIKENLVMKGTLPNGVLQNLSKANCGVLEKVFKALADILNMEEVRYLWLSLLDYTGIEDRVVRVCLNLLLLTKVKLEYSEETQNIFSRLGVKHYAILKKQLVNELQELKSQKLDQARILLQYISHMSNNFKTDLFREFIFNCDKLHPNYIPVIETLLTTHTEYDLLNKSIEFMSNAATDYSRDKSFGKLLFSVVRLLDKDVIRLEQPLKHILGTHRSIWKTKVDKIVISIFEESLTQSFR
ncbi:uncharacterized protein LOC132700916 [Cylas formicarius]|uniref:uncharacterized protein LOC132700916 n=1 Tax=Cylas formicarius TaxID=197179 RepID=UPI00295843E4|nr:uncharacterized protein LOC132700916 [Cylas formicarius]